MEPYEEHINHSRFLSLHRSPIRVFNLPVYSIDSNVVFPCAVFNMAIARLIARVALKMDLSVRFGGGKNGGCGCPAGIRAAAASTLVGAARSWGSGAF